MEDASLKDIEVPEGIELDIGFLLHSIKRFEFQKSTGKKRFLDKLAQIVDWWDASLTDQELERALFLLGEREELSPVLGKEGVPLVAPKLGRPTWPHIKPTGKHPSLCQRKLDLEMLIEGCVGLLPEPLPQPRYYIMIKPDYYSLAPRILRPQVIQLDEDTPTMQPFGDSVTVEPPGGMSSVQPPEGMSTAGFGDFDDDVDHTSLDLDLQRLEDTSGNMDGTARQ